MNEPRAVPIPRLAYLRWAKAHAGASAFNLASSGLTPPPSALLPEPPLTADLAQRGPDMPPRARQRVAKRYGLPHARVMLTLGTAHAMFLATQAHLHGLVHRHGHSSRPRVLVETPSFELLPRLPALLGAEVALFERRMEDGFRLPADLPERILAAKPRLLLLSNPHNPSGAWLSPQQLAPVADAMARVGGCLLVDEVYAEFVEQGRRDSAVHLGEHVAVACSVTKAFGLGTVRFGWLLGSSALIDEAIAFNDYLSVLYPNPSAAVGCAALAGEVALRRRAQQIRRAGLEVLSAWLAQHPQVRCYPSEAGVMALLRLDQVADVDAWCQRLLQEHNTLVAPGSFFRAPDCVRLGFGVAPEVLREGLARMARCL